MRISLCIITSLLLCVVAAIPYDLNKDVVRQLPLLPAMSRPRERALPEGVSVVSSDLPVPEGGTKIRPVIFMHGIFDKPDEPDFATQHITQKVPGAVVYRINLWNSLESIINLYTQLSTIVPAMQTIMDNHTDTGVTLLCYSQGGVICRAVVEMVSTHNVHTMITLSSPLNGQYGVTSYVSWLYPNRDRKYLWEIFYTREGQDFSVGNYWNDPHHQKEFSDPRLDVLIARLNNQTGHKLSLTYKKNFLKLQRLVMIGGPNDTVITPWQSAQFGSYNTNNTAIPFEDQQWYINDDFGLRTLNEANKVTRHTYPGVDHTEWYRDADVYDCCVIPYIT